MERTTIALAALAFLIGALTPLTAHLPGPNGLGANDEGLYQLTGEDPGVHVEPGPEGTHLAVLTPEGDVVLTRALEPGQDATIHPGHETLLVRLFAGAATLEPTQGARLEDVPLTWKKLPLGTGEGETFERGMTIQVPDAWIGINAQLTGDVDALALEAQTPAGPLFTASHASLAHLEDRVHPQAFAANFLHLRLHAQSLTGTLWLELAHPEKRVLDPHVDTTVSLASVDTANSVDATPSFSSLLGVPVRIPVETNATLGVHLDGGGQLLDASVYDQNGDTVHHLHRGPNVADARRPCPGIADCRTQPEPSSHETANATITRELSQGTYTLYLREARMDGHITLTGPDGNTLFDKTHKLSTEIVKAQETSDFSFDTPLLDVWLQDWGTYADRNITVEAEAEPVYWYTSTARASGVRAEAESHMRADRFQSGVVTVLVDDVRPPENGPEIRLLTIGS